LITRFVCISAVNLFQDGTNILHSAFRTLKFAFVTLCLLLTLTVHAATFRFAWLSDTHIGSSTAETDLRASVNDINTLPDLRFVIVSGDVTEFGSGENLRLAKSIFDGLKIPCHIIPGNHDTKWSESGATDFARIWPSDRFEFEAEGYRFIGLHEGPILKMGDGHWAPQDVRWLETTLNAMPDPKQPVIFVTHYPVDDGIDNWHVALDLLKRYNIQAILCGHVHRNGVYNFEGVPGVSGRSNLRGTAAIGGYTTVEVRDGGATSFSERTPGIETKPPWHLLTLQPHRFQKDTNAYPRPDFSVNKKWPGVHKRWRIQTGYTIVASPVVYGETTIVGDASGVIRAVSILDGKELWQFKTHGPVYSTAEVAGDRVVVPSTDGNIYALDAKTGSELWTRETPRAIVASPRVTGDVIYLGSSEGVFRALNLKDGSLKWEFKGLGGFVEDKPLVEEGRVIFGAWDEHLYALDAETGKLLWKWQGDRRGQLYSPAACWPIQAQGTVFIVAPDRLMTALDAASGKQIWRTADYMVRETIGVSEDRARFYVRAMQDYVYGFATAGSPPKKLWQTKPGFGYDINSSMLVEKEGMVFYGTKNGLIFSLDGKTGMIRWQHRLGEALVNTLTPLSGKEVLATDADGTIALLESPH
jgi:outer membrane protein assembly factor BamB/predicted phosphodiesterase